MLSLFSEVDYILQYIDKNGFGMIVLRHHDHDTTTLKILFDNRLKQLIYSHDSS